MTFSISNKELTECKGWSYENIYFFIMILYMGMANGYTQVLCFPPSKGIWTSFIPIILTGILIKRNSKYFGNNTKFINYISLIIIWIILQTIKYSHFYAMNFLLLYNVIMAYIIVCIYKTKIIVLYEKYVTSLSILSLIVWLFYNVMPDVLTSIFSTLFIKSSGTLVANAFFVGLANSTDILGFRNVGFAQEPGYFASYIIIAMFFNLLINNYKYINRNFIILLITLITTQSTTGYVAFGVIIILIILQSKRGKIFMITLMILLLPTIIALPFMREKIVNYSSDKESIENVVWNADYIEGNGGNGVFVPQRFDGFVLEAMNFIHDPILGYGVKDNNTSYVSKNLSPYISCSNGNIKVFSRFGLVLGCFFFVLLYKTGRILDIKNRTRISLFFLLIYMVISMSYEIATIPLLLSIWNLGFFIRIK